MRPSMGHPVAEHEPDQEGSVHGQTVGALERLVDHGRPVGRVAARAQSRAAVSAVRETETVSSRGSRPKTASAIVTRVPRTSRIAITPSVRT